jgi:hypothetical protein
MREAAPEPREEDRIVQPSSSVIAIQQKVAGVLPIPIDVPRAGVTLRFARPLVLDDETRIDFHYKRRYDAADELTMYKSRRVRYPLRRLAAWAPRGSALPAIPPSGVQSQEEPIWVCGA